MNYKIVYNGHNGCSSTAFFSDTPTHGSYEWWPEERTIFFHSSDGDLLALYTRVISVEAIKGAM